MSLYFLQLSSTKLGSTFESTAELNYLGRPKLVLGSAHVKFDVLTGPKVLQTQITRTISICSLLSKTIWNILKINCTDVHVGIEILNDLFICSF